MSAKSKISSKGQITIPSDIRKALNVGEGDYLIFEAKSEYEVNVRVMKSRPLTSLLGALKAPEKDADFDKIRDQAREDLAARKSKHKAE